MSLVHYKEDIKMQNVDNNNASKNSLTLMARGLVYVSLEIRIVPLIHAQIMLSMNSAHNAK